MAKDVKFGNEARQKMLAGVNILADAVKAIIGTFGNKGFSKFILV